MKVLICHNYYRHTSGEDLVIANDIEILRRRGLSIIEYRRSNTEIDNFTLYQRIAFFRNTIYSRSTAREVETLVKKERPDVVLVQNVFPLISPSIYYALYRFRVPIIQLVYNYRLICPNAILFTQGKICERCIKGNFAHAVHYKCYKDSYLLSALYAFTLTVHRHIGCISKLITAYVTPDLFLKYKLVEGGYPKERIFPILNPFDITKYTPYAGHEGYFVYIGRIVREKGIFTLLKAMLKLPHSRLVVVGKGKAEKQAIETVKRENMKNVEFVGPKYDDDLIAVLRGALAVIVPTEWYDNSPLVVHQAFALGKPVIASNIDGIPEIIQDNQDGLLFQPGDPTELAEKMVALESDEEFRQRLGKNVRRKAEEFFTTERRVGELMKVIEFAQKNVTCS